MEIAVKLNDARTELATVEADLPNTTPGSNKAKRLRKRRATLLTRITKLSKKV